MNSIRLFLTVTNRTDSEQYTVFFEKHGIGALFETVCNGTARAKTLDLFGLEHTEKCLIYSFVTAEKSAALIGDLRTGMQIDSPGRGIALSIPVDSAGGKSALEYFFEDSAVGGAEVKKMDYLYELIICIAQRGYTDEVMDAARSAGAGGGTVVHAKGTGAKQAEKFLGLSLADEKEMIFIVAPTEKKKDIMYAIMRDAGASTPAHALVFSLPVSDAAGFGGAESLS